MAKDQKIPVNQNDVTRNGHTVSVLTVGKYEIGYIEEVDAKFIAYLNGSSQPNHFKTMDDAVDFLISDYHLHH